MKATIQHTDDNSMEYYIIRHENGELFRSTIYTNKYHLAAELTEEEIKELHMSVAGMNFKINLCE